MAAAMTRITMLEALQNFYKKYEIPADSGNASNWVRLEVGPMVLYAPNFDARRKAVVYHDSHHVITGYKANLIGECEIGAWEIAAGCGTYWAAWLYNTIAMLSGMIIAPKRTFKAFVRGRHARSLYGMDTHTILGMTTEALRHCTGVDVPTPAATFRDYSAFGAIAALGVTTMAAALTGLFLLF